MSKIILGSSSVARRHILAEMGYEFEVMTADIDERSIRREKPEELVAVLAEAKADAIISKLKIADYQVKDAEPTLLITSDIVDSGPEVFFLKVPNDIRLNGVVVLLLRCRAATEDLFLQHGIIREKPNSKEEAWEFLKGYSGGHVSTVGSVLVTNLKTGRKCGGIDKAEVYFHDIPKEIIENLIDEGVVFKVAGGLLLEHPLILPLVEAVVGATDSVMGLPKALTEKLIDESLSLQS